MIFSDRAIRLRAAPGVDKYGYPDGTWDWDNPDPLLLTQVSIQPVGESSEELGTRTAVTSQWLLVTRPWGDADIEPTDRVTFYGVTAEVVGEVSRYRLGGRVHHVEARLERVEG